MDLLRGLRGGNPGVFFEKTEAAANSKIFEIPGRTAYRAKAAGLENSVIELLRPARRAIRQTCLSTVALMCCAFFIAMPISWDEAGLSKNPAAPLCSSLLIPAQIM